MFWSLIPAAMVIPFSALWMFGDEPLNRTIFLFTVYPVLVAYHLMLFGYLWLVQCCGSVRVTHYQVSDRLGILLAMYYLNSFLLQRLMFDGADGFTNASIAEQTFGLSEQRCDTIGFFLFCQFVTLMVLISLWALFGHPCCEPKREQEETTHRDSMLDEEETIMYSKLS